MTRDDELGMLRLRFQALERLAAHLDRGPLVERKPILGRVFNDGSMPAFAGSFYAVHPVDVAGPEVEGGPASLTDRTDERILVDVLGDPDSLAVSPKAGDLVLCAWTNRRWIGRLRRRIFTSCFVSRDDCLVPPTGGPPVGEITGAVGTFTSRRGHVYTSTVSDGQLWAIVVGLHGSGYDPLNPPAVVIGGPGSGATAVANIIGGQIFSVAVTNRGTGYDPTTVPPVSFVGGPGSGATATARVNNMFCVTAPRGTYSIEITRPDYVTIHAIGQTLPAGITSNNVFNLLPVFTFVRNLTIRGIGGLPIAGAVWTTSNANNTNTCTTDAAGQCTSSLAFDEDSGYVVTTDLVAAGYVPIHFVFSFGGGLDVCEPRAATVNMTPV